MAAAIPATEAQALRALYESTAGSNWTNKTGWLGAAGTECSWAGVGCNDDRTSVVQIYLYSNNLVGTLPGDLRNLTNLRSLVLAGNALGTIPASLGSVASLEELNLTYCQLTGAIPSQLGSLSNLKTLNLQNNQLSGSIPASLGGLSKLVELDLGANQLSGAMPADLSRLSALQNLYLGNNELTGGIPRELGNLASIQRIYLNDNPLGGTIPAELGNLRTLVSLVVYSTQLTGTIPGGLGNLASLQEIDLSGNQLSGTIPPDLGRLGALQRLSIAGNQLTGSIPPELAQLGALQRLELNGNQLSGSIPAELGGLKELVTLSLYSNRLTGAIPAQLGTLAKLEALYLADNQLTGTVPDEISGLTSLTSLYLNGNQITGINAAALGKLTKLETFSAAGNPLTQPAALEPLGGLKSLRVLDLQRCGLTGAVPAFLATATSLTELHLGGNELSGPVPDLGALVNLADLGLNDNDLTGPISPDLGQLRSLLYLSLEHNHLSGTIPRELGNLANLLYLNAHGNELSGSIPGALGGLSKLNQLHLEENQLTGPIPGELGSLSALRELTLYDNQLTGGLPSFAGLRALTYLDLRGNQIGGSIPADIGNLTELYFVSLSGNRIQNLPPELGRLSNLTYLFLEGNLIAGSIPKELGELVSLQQLDLRANQLTGSIPTELGNLKKLERLRLNYNQLTGPIPASMGGMDALREMSLESNQFTGSLPAALGSLKAIEYIDLTKNALSGAIPSELSGLATLRGLYLGGNMLVGALPSTLTRLTNLNDGYGLDLRYNALRTDDAALRDFINRKGYNFDFTQTLAPTDLQAPVTSTASVTLRWNPIVYQSDAGGYEVLVSSGSSAPTVGATTATKEVSSATVKNLTPGTTYTFSVRTVTQPSDNNPNTVTSEAGSTVTATTTAAGSITVTLTPSNVRTTPGTNINMTATLSPAASAPLTLTLSSSNAQVASVPASVSIPAGATTTTFAVSGQRTGTTIVTAALPASVGGSSAAADVTVADSACVRPNTPFFITTNSSNVAVRGGNSITLLWTPVLARDPLGTYQVDLFPNSDCRTGLRQFTVDKATLTVPTRASQAGVFCLVVRAISSDKCVSGDSSPLLVTVQPGPATFVVAQSAPVSAVTSLNVPPAPVKVSFKNIGFTAATLTVRANLGFATPSPTSFPAVAPGGTVETTLTFDPLATVSSSLQQGSLCGVWTEGTEKTVCAAVTLSVLATPPSPGTLASRPQLVASNEIHFIQAAGSTPPTQFVTVRNPSARAMRIAPSIGPGGAWLRLETSDILSAIPPGGTRDLTLSVDRSKRATAEGAPPLSTQLILTNVDGPDGDRAILQVFDEEPPPAVSGANRAYLAADEYSLILGSSVNATGSGGTIFISDGWIRNKAPNQVTADLFYTPSGTDGIGNPQVRRATVTLQPYSTYRLSDFVRGLFETSGSGSVEIRSRAIADLSVRTTVDALTLKGDNRIRFGAEIPTVQSREGVGVSRLGGASLLLPGLRSGAGSASRTNVILTETSGRPAIVALRLFKDDGTLLQEKTVPILAYSQIQINSNNTSLFPDGMSFDGASLEVKPVAGTGTVAAFATVIDNASQGYTTRTGRFLPQALTSGTVPGRKPLAGVTRLAVATAAHAAGRNNSFFTTSVSITNGVASVANLTLKYVVNGETAATQTVAVPGRATVNYKDIIATLFGIPDNTAGMIFVEGDVGKVVVSSDTSTLLTPGQEALGLSPSTLSGYAPESTNALGDPQGGPPSPVVSHPALEESTRFRTNLILAEVTGAPVTVRVRIVPPGSAGVPLAEKDFTLKAFERIQVNQFMLDMAGPGEYLDHETTVEWVSGAGRALSVATKIDNDPDSKRSDVYVLGPTGGLQGTIGF